MTDFPEGWAIAALPELITADGVFVDGDWVESKDQDPNGEVRLIQLADIGDGFFIDKSNRSLTHSRALELGCTFLEKGDVLVARMPDPLGRACVFPGDRRKAVTVVDVCVVRGQFDHFDNRWLMHFINAPVFRERIHELQSGSTRKRISRGNLSTLKLPIPPRFEQTRIVEKLEELLSDLDVGVAELKAAQKKLALYRQSLLKAAVEGALTADWRAERAARGEPQETGADLLARILTERRARWEARQRAKFEEQGKMPPKGWQARYPEPVRPDTAELPMLPEGWAWASVAQLGEVTTGFTPSTTDAENFGGTIPFFKPGDLDAGYYVEQSRERLSEAGAAIGRVLPEKSVLVTCIGATIGKTGFARVPCATNQQINALSVSESEVIPEFVYWLMVSGTGQRQIIKNASATTLPILNKSKFEKLVLPIAPLSEQTEIVSLLETESERISSQETAISHALRQATVQRKNLLKAAFSGQLVPQDPDDEPASALLARIRAEREARSTGSARRTRRTTHA